MLRPRRGAAKGDLDAAVLHFHSGRLDEGAQLIQRVLEGDPDNAAAWNLLGAISLEQGNENAAVRYFEDAADLAPSDADIVTNLAETRRRIGDLDGAETAARSALRINPGCVTALHTLTLTLTAQGRGAEAYEYGRVLVSLDPDFSSGREAYLFLLQLTDVLDPEEIAAEHRRLMQRISVPAQWRSPRHANARDAERRLRVGYVSADFCQHAAIYFILPILLGHDPEKFDVICYSSVKHPDEATKKLRTLGRTWRDVARLPDEKLATLIVDDEVDILVDLSGPTRGNRLGVFARKPAPLQLTWFGYPGTTGLACMDYKITDRFCDPPGMSDVLYSERLLRLPDVMYCYQPPPNMPEVEAPPVTRNEYVTFGAMNGAAKLTPDWIAVWAELLCGVPQSRLLLAAVPAGATHKRLRELFLHHGVDPGRVTIHDRKPCAEFWALHHEIDIALDTYPCNGGTSTCETLWLGVPVVTFAGRRYGGNRLGTSMLSNIGLQDLVAHTPAEYRAIALSLASDLAQLKTLRLELRERMGGSPLTDRVRFIHSLESSYRDIWRAWCARAVPGH